MGTNYYLYQKPVLSKVLELIGMDGRYEKIRRWLWKYDISSSRGMHGTHIGKSSGGWVFALHVAGKYDDPNSEFFYINNLEDWMDWIHDSNFYIANEYGDVVTSSQMTEIITSRSWRNQWTDQEKSRLGEAEYFRQRGGVPGPNGLARNRIDGYHCIGHGAGTYDYIVGEFS